MYQNRRVKSAPLSLSISFPPSILPKGTLKTGSVDMLAMKGQQTRIDHPPACSTVNFKKKSFLLLPTSVRRQSRSHRPTSGLPSFHTTNRGGKYRYCGYDGDERPTRPHRPSPSFLDCDFLIFFSSVVRRIKVTLRPLHLPNQRPSSLPYYPKGRERAAVAIWEAHQLTGPPRTP